MSHGIAQFANTFVSQRATGALLLGLGLLMVCGCGGGPRKGPKLGAIDVKKAQKVDAKGKTVEAAPSDATPPANANNAANNDPNNPPENNPDGNAADPNTANQANTEAVDINARLERLDAEQGIGAPVILITEVGTVLTQDVANALAQKSSNPLETFINARANAENKLDTGNIKKAMKALRASNGKPPRTIKEFVAGFKEMECTLPALEPGEFYVYDPDLATQEANDDGLDYLTIFKN